jgi:geranylgeranyl reductase family protein
MSGQATTGFNYDVVVAGGGPAGSSSAYYAARLGLKTLLLEKEAYPRDKPCGGALSERNIPLLGKNAIAAINCAMDELHLYAPSFKNIVSQSLPGHFIIRREFDAAMAQDAREAGAEVRENCAVQVLQPLPTSDSSDSAQGYNVITPGEPVTARYVILANGYRNNSLMRQLGIEKPREKDWLAMCMVSETPIDQKVLEKTNFSRKSLAIFFGAVPNGYGWCFVKEGYLNIGIGATARLLKQVGVISAYREFVNTLRQKGLLPPELQLAKEYPYPLPFKRTVRKSVFGHVLLVGDDAGFVSPVTGEGIYYAIKGGQLAAEAISLHLEQGLPLTSYQEKWLQAFGKDLNRYGYFMRERLYRSVWRMELAVACARHDNKFADLLKQMIIGANTYRKTLRKIILRFPITLCKFLF